jgi:type VI secretion system protein VasJ
MTFDQTIQALGTTPIPGDAPSGQSSRYEPEFEHMQGEIDKLTSLTGAAPDWQSVVSDASAILSGKSKDLMAASYLCAALRETRGWDGLADGLNLIKHLLATFWDTVHPGKLRARKAALDWLLDRMKVAIEPLSVSAGDREATASCIALVDEIVAFGEGRWENEPPTVWSLGQAIKDKVGAIPAEAAPPAGGAGAGSGSGAKSSGAASPQALSPGGAPSGRAEAYRQIVAAADYLIAVEPHSPVPYLLRRAAAWGGMALPQLYVELQRSGSVWDFVLGGVPEGGAPSSAPAIAEAAPPRGDF